MKPYTLLTVVFTILFWAVILQMVILKDLSVKPVGYAIGVLALSIGLVGIKK
ncbi:hypothetical protein [Methanococcus maripaludis]|uniref:Cbb3-type cytochrome oxidase subunit 3 n=1 Tax=Methanococcus maripaludis TaxID=39152 RepID=A0A8T4H6X4_METMI|nr:hypothetical protein [Methanococcus maripaludis]MBM7408793.1 cbb3-type cytochrome oxidase subunit 3 [Methanococcus maripaludis]MBP2219038.1 cbb3-type cytochrome oxidase subunit 3 [Methanococcus maripaludis]